MCTRMAYRKEIELGWDSESIGLRKRLFMIAEGWTALRNFDEEVELIGPAGERLSEVQARARDILTAEGATESGPPDISRGYVGNVGNVLMFGSLVEHCGGPGKPEEQPPESHDPTSLETASRRWIRDPRNAIMGGVIGD